MATRKPKGEGLAAIVAKQDPVSIQELTMQDFFAAFALQGLIIGTSMWREDEDDFGIANSAYSLADAMLKARG